VNSAERNRRIPFHLLLAIVSVLAEFIALAPRDAGAKEAGPDTLLALERREETTPNGLRLIIVKGGVGTGGVVIARFPAGEASVPAAKRGLARLAAEALAGGSVEQPGAAFEAALAAIGGRFSARATLDAIVVAIEAPPERLADATALLAELLHQPAYPDSLVTLLKSRLIDEASRPLGIDEIAGVVLERVLFDRHPYAYGTTAATVGPLTAGDLHAFHREKMGIEDAAVVVAGEFHDERPLLAAARRAFSPLPLGEIRPRDRTLPAPQWRRRVYLVHLEGATQAAIAVGNTALRADDSDLPAALLIARVLSDPDSGRIVRRLVGRGKPASRTVASLVVRRQLGLFAASAVCANEAADSVAVLLLDALEEPRREAFPTGEIERAAAALTAEHVARLSTALSLAEATADGDVTERDAGSGEQFAERLESLPMYEILRVARRLLRPFSAPLVFVGDGTKLASRIARFGEVNWLDAAGAPLPAEAIPAAARRPAPRARAEISRAARAGGATESAGAALTDSALTDSSLADSSFADSSRAGAVSADVAPPDSSTAESRGDTSAPSGAAEAKPPSPYDMTPFRGDKEDTYTVLSGDQEIGLLVVRVAEDEWDERAVIAVHARLSGPAPREIALAFRAEDFSPLSSQISRGGDSLATNATLHYGGDRVAGRLVDADGTERTIDADLPEGTIDARMIPCAIRALSLPEGAVREISTFGPTSGGVAIARIIAEEVVEVILPSGSTTARRIVVDGSEAAGTYFVDETPNRRIVMFVSKAAGLTFLVK